MKSQARVAANLDALFGYALGLCRNRDDAKDLVQECALKALSARKVPVDAPAYRAWLFRILRNCFIDKLRDESDTDPLADDPPDPDFEAGRHEHELINSLAVQRAMTALSLEHREVIALVDMAGFTYAEAADLTGVPIGTVMSRLSRGRKLLIGYIRNDNVRALPLRAAGAKR